MNSFHSGRIVKSCSTKPIIIGIDLINTEKISPFVQKPVILRTV